MMSGYQRIRGLSPVARGGIRCVAVGWEMRWGQWKAVFGHKIDSVLSLRYDIRLSLGLWLALAFSIPWPSTPTDRLPYILLIPSPFFTVFLSPSRPRNAHDFLSFSSTPSPTPILCRLDRRSHPRSECSPLSFVSRFPSQPRHDRPLSLWMSIQLGLKKDHSSRIPKPLFLSRLFRFSLLSFRDQRSN